MGMALVFREAPELFGRLRVPPSIRDATHVPGTQIDMPYIGLSEV